MITKEDIVKRLEALERDLQTLSEQHSAVRGAIADCKYWLSELEKSNGEEKEVEGPLKEKD